MKNIEKAKEGFFNLEKNLSLMILESQQASK